ncbi:hypothetical protein [Cupriavidus taiwanensis]|uniref:hypothetical protein n=1 Tax=Cupriavidus taiwanensis TaxID=164546 RepID=UPI0011AEB53C|nr:hypothetical protein [Cupriavidus taiwanensis]
MTTDDVLRSLGSNWDGLVEAGKKWYEENPKHQDRDKLLALLSSSDRGRNTKIKSVRQLIPAILGSRAPWEVVVGQVIGRISGEVDEGNNNSIIDYIGRDVLVALGLLEVNSSTDGDS